MATLTTGALFVFLLIAVALVLFVTEPVPIDVTAIGIMVSLMILEPWTGVTPSDGIAGFSNPATITILAMMVLSEGVRRTGLIQRLQETVAEYTGGDVHRQLGATIGIVGPLSALINNTAAVAVLVPMVNDLAHDNGTSPSKLLLPLSYASMLGGMLTLIGTSTNLIASSLSAEYLGHPFSMFEFTALGAVVFVVGSAYLLTVGYWLAPSHVTPRSERSTATEEEYLTELVVRQHSPAVGLSLRDALEEVDFEAEVTQLIRDDRYVTAPPLSTTIRSGDVYTIRLTEDALQALLEIEGIDLVPSVTTETELDSLAPEQTLVGIVLTAGSDLIGETVESANFTETYQARVLAVRRGGEITHERLTELTLRPGDVLLIESDPETVDRFANDPNVIVAGDLALQQFRRSKLPIAVGTVLGVVGLAAVGVVPIVVSALAGVATMLAAGVVKPAEAYEAVQWDVIFLLAGVIPLGDALAETGGADVLGALVVSSADVLPAIGVLGLFYLLTALMTNVVSNQASVVLLVPVAVDVASRLGVNAFAFVLAVTFAASTAFMTPVGYQTNLFVYGPGQYEFRDFVRVGGPLQLLLAVVTTVGIVFFWGL
ncbi:Di-and tricarboxylate transporter [Halobiforma haloterrestris]|uniref:Di-and tricarboxylate transporter n=1 Tax=Natronobacterium haloterrestre TaxID=148448 RepID=A0A1I1JQ84_NATHA|nr:SLC13 family permease [Halobiforma haloterrestris]SFC50789.1 Di-and tricarboxylate transporter [Halobiforma haloterrestris]